MSFAMDTNINTDITLPNINYSENIVVYIKHNLNILK